MAENRNTFIGGINQDTATDKSDKTKIYRGINIKILSEEGLSSGAIENEDGNLVSFGIPDTFGSYKIQYKDTGAPEPGTLTIHYTDPTTGTIVNISTASKSSIEDLYFQLQSVLAPILDVNVKVILNNDLIYIVNMDATVISVTGTGGLATNVNTYEVAPQTGLKIIGWGTVRNEVVVFTTSDSSAIPTGSAGQIWKFEYDLITKQVVGLVNGDLSIVDHMIYNNILNFSTEHHIGTETVGNYENSLMAKIYWTDEYNSLRSINILDPKSLSLSPSSLAIVSGFKASLARVTDLGSGSLDGARMYQYCYRLSNTGGQPTAFSPLTNPLPFGNFFPKGLTSTDGYFKSNGSDNPAKKHSITYEVENIDTDYELIEHIAIMSDASGNVEIYKFGEELVPGDGNLTVVHSDRGLDIPITEEEFVFITGSFKTCKTITSKDKRLIAANLTTNSLPIDNFDARAYRYNTSSLSLLGDNERTDITLDFSNNQVGNPGLTIADVPEDFDCINIFNDDTTIQDNSADEYKYQKDGLTLGGEGINVSYEFVTEDLEAKSTLSGYSSSGTNRIYNVANVSKYSLADYNTDTLNGNKVRLQNTFKSFKGPSNCQHFKGYARGETYRVGIQFYGLDGSPENVKWIGDIRIPESQNVDGTGSTIKRFNLSDESNGKLYSKSIGIKFNIDISSIIGEISGYEIVRLKRDLKDRTKLGTGVMSKFTAGKTDGPANRFGAQTGQTGPPIPTAHRFEGSLFAGNGVEGYLGLDDYPGVSAEQNQFLMYGFMSPITCTSLNTQYFNIIPGDKVKVIEYHTGKYEGGKDYNEISNTSTGKSDTYKKRAIMANNVLASYPSNSYNLPAIYQEVRIVNNGQILSPGDIIGANSYAGQGLPLWNASPTAAAPPVAAEELPSGFGTQKGLLELSSDFTYLDPSGTTLGGTQGFANRHLWKIVSYERALINQYGGNTNEARGFNKYISTGSFVQIRNESTTTQEVTVFGGDVFTQYYPHHYFYHPTVNGDGTSPGGNAAYAYGLGFVCESSANVELLQTDNWSQTYFSDWYNSTVTGFDSNTGPSNLNIYFNFSKDNEAKAIHFSKDFFTTYPTEFPHRIWASEKKLDGELYDSWKKYLINNYSEVDGLYGEINKITTLKDVFYYYQDRAFGAASVNDRAVINDEDGNAMTIGSGGILDDYKYISRNTGTKHKFSVVTTGAAIHHYDDILDKWIRYADGPRPVSDIQGLHSTFLKFNGGMKKSDRILNGKGIHGIFDKVRNKVLMTFLSSETIPDATPYDRNHTISYNENLQAFDAEYTYTPAMWLETHGKVLALNTDLKDAYLQYEGEKNNFFGTVHPSTIEIVIAPSADILSVFDTIAYKSEISISDVDQINSTFDSIRIFNDHQESGVVPLVPDGNVIRKLRSWRTNVPRDINSPNQDARMRNYFVRLVLTHTPNSNERLVLHDIVTTFRVAPH